MTEYLTESRKVCVQETRPKTKTELLFVCVLQSKSLKLEHSRETEDFLKHLKIKLKQACYKNKRKNQKMCQSWVTVQIIFWAVRFAIKLFSGMVY